MAIEHRIVDLVQPRRPRGADRDVRPSRRARSRSASASARLRARGGSVDDDLRRTGKQRCAPAVANGDRWAALSSGRLGSAKRDAAALDRPEWVTDVMVGTDIVGQTKVKAHRMP